MNKFKLEIMTPERQFLEEDVDSLTVLLPDGQLTVLAGHMPMVAVLAIGELTIRSGDTSRMAFYSEGFMEVRPDEVIIFVQACEWPDEIDERRASEALERANEKMRQQQSLIEHKNTQIAIARAMARLRVSSSKSSNMFDQ